MDLLGTHPFHLIHTSVVPILVPHDLPKSYRSSTMAIAMELYRIFLPTTLSILGQQQGLQKSHVLGV